MSSAFIGYALACLARSFYTFNAATFFATANLAIFYGALKFDR